MTAALTGVRLLDLTSGTAGGLVGMILADFGAEVLRVTRRKGSDPAADALENLAAAPMWHRGKYEVALDLTRDDERERFDELCAGADVLLCNWRPATLTRHGLDADNTEAALPASGLLPHQRSRSRRAVCQRSGIRAYGGCTHGAHATVPGHRRPRRTRVLCAAGGCARLRAVGTQRHSGRALRARRKRQWQRVRANRAHELAPGPARLRTGCDAGSAVCGEQPRHL